MKKAFTLLEILISVAILSFLVMFMYKNVSLLKTSNDFFQDRYKKISKDTMLHESLFLDIAQSSDTVNVVDDDENSILKLRTKNSHFGISHPFVIYLLKSDKIFRIESIKALPTPLNSDALEYVKYEVAKNDVKVFKVFQKSDDFLIRVDKMMFQIQR